MFTFKFFNSLKQKVKDQEAQLISVTRDYEALKASFLERDEERKNLKNMVQDKSEVIEQQGTTLQIQWREIETLRELNQQLSEKNEELMQRVQANSKDMFKVLKEENEKLKEQVKQGVIQRADLIDLKNDYQVLANEAQAKVEELRNNLSGKQEVIQRQSDIIAQLRKELQESSDRCSAEFNAAEMYRQQATSLLTEKENLCEEANANELANYTKIEELKQALNEAKNFSQVQKLEEAIKEKAAIEASLLTEKGEMKIRITELEKELANQAGGDRLIQDLRNDVKNLTYELQAQKDVNKGLIKDLQASNVRELADKEKIKRLEAVGGTDPFNARGFEHQSLIAQLNACHERIKLLNSALENPQTSWIVLSPKAWEFEMEVSKSKAAADHYLDQCGKLRAALDAEKEKSRDADKLRMQPKSSYDILIENRMAELKTLQEDVERLMDHRLKLNARRKKLAKKYKAWRRESFSLTEYNEGREEEIQRLFAIIKDELAQQGISLSYHDDGQGIVPRIIFRPVTDVIERPIEVEVPLNNAFEFLLTEEMDRLKVMLIQKNRSYGNSALDPIRIFSKSDHLEGIRVRLDDKLSRLARGKEYPGDNDVDDIQGYLFLYKIGMKLDRKSGTLD